MTRNPFHDLLWAVYPSVYDTLWDNRLTAGLADEVVRALPAGLEVDEVGAGTGLITHRIAASGLSVHPSEPNDRMRSRLRKRLPDLTVERLDLASLPPAAGPPRSVVAVNVLHLTADPEGDLRRLRAAAGQNGLVVVVTPAKGVGVMRVAAAARAAGGTLRDALRFVGIHVALAPLVLLSRKGRARALDAGGASSVSSFAGVADIFVFAGT